MEDTLDVHPFGDIIESMTDILNKKEVEAGAAEELARTQVVEAEKTKFSIAMMGVPETEWGKTNCQTSERTGRRRLRKGETLGAGGETACTVPRETHPGDFEFKAADRCDK